LSSYSGKTILLPPIPRAPMAYSTSRAQRCQMELLLGHARAPKRLPAIADCEHHR
jgi:hypothetical protein